MLQSNKFLADASIGRERITSLDERFKAALLEATVPLEELLPALIS